jgi:hypothetical protein
MIPMTRLRPSSMPKDGIRRFDFDPYVLPGDHANDVGPTRSSESQKPFLALDSRELQRLIQENALFGHFQGSPQSRKCTDLVFA